MIETTISQASEDPKSFREALGRFATGVTVVTIPTLEGPMGFTANSFASVSLDPPLVLWSPARNSARFPFYAAATYFSIHVLGAEQADLCRRFVRGGTGFDNLDHEINAEGVPIIPGTLARFDCAQRATHDGGDHLVIVGLVQRARYREGGPLVFSQGTYGRFEVGL
jgi:flavin reductase (DIM6/NTAB) family NADH-FMN oxidoreductase RutF